MAHEPKTPRPTDSGFTRNGNHGEAIMDADLDDAAPESPAELAHRLRRLETQLEALLARPPAPPPPTPRTNSLAAVTGLVVPALNRLSGSTLPDASGRFGFLTEFRLMARMYVDPRYRLSRVAQFGVPAVLVLMVLNNIVWPSLWVFTSVFMQLVLVVLSVVLYKLLSREAARYAAVLAYLARSEGARP